MELIKNFINAENAIKCIDNLVATFVDFNNSDWSVVEKETFKEFASYAVQGNKIKFMAYLREHGVDAVFNSEFRYCKENLDSLMRRDIRWMIQVIYKDGMFIMKMTSK